MGPGGHILQGHVQDATGWCEHWEPDLCLGSLRPPASQLTHGDSWSGPFFEILGDPRPYPHVLKIVRLPGLGSLDARRVPFGLVQTMATQVIQSSCCFLIQGSPFCFFVKERPLIVKCDCPVGGLGCWGSPVNAPPPGSGRGHCPGGTGGASEKPSCRTVCHQQPPCPPPAWSVPFRL